ncbi:hypothetical protein Hypma_010701 [Hypsizygus marmoreus]|uniref:CENP-C homolog n=1 Tax=Hypsizygus marmoreus TaxID=39966 RepID=A0A369JNT4_HYPMA|nr:hypothetical protein Hypma_010701 [Hypsizygus marmoreus]
MPPARTTKETDNASTSDDESYSTVMDDEPSSSSALTNRNASSTTLGAPHIDTSEAPVSSSPGKDTVIPTPPHSDSRPPLVVLDDRRSSVVVVDGPSNGSASQTGTGARGPGGSVPHSSSLKRRKQAKDVEASLDSPRPPDSTERYGTVVEYGSEPEECSRALIFPSKSSYTPQNIPFQRNKNKNWTFQKIFGEADFFASGFLYMQPHSEKEVKSVMDNAYVFLVLEGAIEAKIHKSTYVLSSGGAFQVPRGNTYSIKNISNSNAKLFFAQARKPLLIVDSDSLPGERHVPFNRRPTTKAAMLLHWFFQRLITRLLQLRVTVLTWYRRHLSEFERYFMGRRLYFICFVLGLMIRRLPFIGSPPLLNIQIIRVS